MTVLAVVALSSAVFFIVRSQLLGQVDSDLRDRAVEISGAPFHLEPVPTGSGVYLNLGPGRPVSAGLPYIQAVRADGKVFKTLREQGSLGISHRVIAVARGQAGAYFSTEHISGTGQVRVRTVPLANGYALQVARSLGDVNHTMSLTTALLVLVTLGGIGVAAGLGLLVSRRS